MSYDPNEAPDRDAWLALQESERIDLAVTSHRGRAGDPLHADDMNPIMHGALHAVIETQVASGKPAATRQALDRLLLSGLTRHAATHALMRVLALHLGGLGEGRAFDQVGYAGDLGAIQPVDVVTGGLQRLAPARAPENRSQRRAARKARKGRKD